MIEDERFRGTYDEEHFKLKTVKVRRDRLAGLIAGYQDYTPEDSPLSHTVIWYKGFIDQGTIKKPTFPNAAEVTYGYSQITGKPETRVEYRGVVPVGEFIVHK